MRRWIAAILITVLAGSWAPPLARSQSTPLVGGGLTALPVVKLGPNQALNGGFETLSGGYPASWSGGAGWSMDQLTKRSGTFSYRRDTGAATSSQPLPLKQGTYKFSAWIKTQNLGTSTAGVRLQLDFRPAVNNWTTTSIIYGTTDWTLYEIPNIVVTQDSTVTLKLENYGNPSGTAWFDDAKLEEQLPQPVDAFLLYPNFRGMLFDDGPSTLKFDVTVTPPNGDFGRYQLKGTLKDETTGQIVATRTYAAAAHVVADLEGGAMQMGRGYLATLSLVDGATGADVYAYPAYRVSRVSAAARPSMNLSFDAKNRVLVKGVPRFILGVYDSGSGYSTQDSFWEDQLWSPTGARRMDGMKINMYLNYWYGEAPADSMKALMSNLQKHGVTYLQTGNCFDKYPAGSNFLINSSDAYVQDIGSHAASAGYYTIDECKSGLIPGAFDQYERLRRLDPDAITFSANFGDANLYMWRDSADVISTDPYPLYGAEPAGGYNHKQVADWTRVSREAVKGARPIMTVLQFFKFTSQGRWPTLPEMRSHAWMAVVEGAMGLWWWSLGDNALKNVCSDWCAERTTYMNNLKSVVNEVAALEPVLLADDTPGALTGNSNASIKTKVKVVDGKGYLFAYNYTNASQTATFSWNTAPGTVTVNAENRSVPVSGNSFTDTFGAYEAHVYVLGTGGGGGTPAPTSPTVTFTSPSAGATVSGTTTVTLAASGGSGSGYTYTLAVDGTPIAGTGPSFSWNTATATNGSHTLTATVRDSAGQAGTATRSVTVSNTTTPPAAPTVRITSPAAGATVTGSVPVSLAASGGSGSGYSYRLAVDGSTVYTGTAAGWTWNTTGIANGSHTLTATVTDSAGASGTASVTVTVSNTPPAGTLKVTITAPKAGATVSGTGWATIWVGGTTGTSNTYSLTLGGKAMGSTTTASTGPVSVPYDTKMVADGTQTLAATVKDATGNTGTSSVSIIAKNGVTGTPVLTASFTSPAAGATVGGTTTVGMSVSGSTASSRTFRLAVDGTVVSTQTVSGTTASYAWNTTSVANGSRTLTLTATDSLGGSATATRTVTVSNTNPTGTLKVYITQPASGGTVSGTVWAVLWVEGQSGSSNTFTLSANGKVVASQVTASRGPVSLPWVSSGTPNGAVTLTGSVKDATGKTGSTSITVTVAN